MKVPISWLRDFVNINIPVKELADRLSEAGVIVDKIEYPPEKISGVFAGKIEEIKKHENADKLRVAQINTGKEKVQIVTGAQNVQKGDIIPVALIDANLAGGLKIKKSSLRGVDSFGMMCSAKELGIDIKDLPKDEQEGVMILPQSYALGVDLAAYLDLFDPVLVIEPFANRSDCLSVLGVAYEAANILGEKIKRKEFSLSETQESAAELIKVKIENYKDCPRYIARVIKGVQIRPSDLKMKLRLNSVGIRAINNAVDITNYVMMELGHPLHAFDYDKIKGSRIIIRRAKKDENFITLDGAELKLSDSALVIADSEKPVALAGVMGGIGTEVTENTKNILLESALFDPALVRRASLKYSLKTESAKRFEKGLDFYSAEDASRQASFHIAAGGARLAKGAVSDAITPPGRVKISLRPERAGKLLGVNFKMESVIQKFSNLGYTIEKDNGNFNMEVPFRRKDIKEEIDLIEEAARINGYDKVGYTLPRGESTCAAFSRELVFEKNARRLLERLGLSEVITYAMIHPEVLAKFKIDENNCLKILNPLSSEQSFMRPKIMPSLVCVIDYNLRNKNEDLRIFEISHIYKKDKTAKHFAVAFCPKENAKNDFFVLKGVIEKLFADLNIPVSYTSDDASTLFHPGINADVAASGVFIGRFGKLHPQIVENFSITKDIFCAEFDMTEIFKLCADKKYKPFSRYPAVERDLALVMPEKIKCVEVEKVINTAARNLIKCLCFDEYKGGQIPPNYKSLAFNLVFQSYAGTLKDEEINKSMDEIKTALKEKLGAQIRE